MIHEPSAVDNQELLPCPFCGGVAELVHGSWYGFANCIRCRSRTTDIQGNSPQQIKTAIAAAWNSRVVVPLPAQALWNAVRSLERDLERCADWRDKNAQGSASFSFHNQAVKQCTADIESLRALIEGAKQ